MSPLLRGLRLVALRMLLCGVATGFFGAASAQEVVNLQRTFQLRDGSIVTGQLVEYVPGQRVVLLGADGQARTIAWTELLTTESLRHRDELLPVRVTAERPVELYETPREGKERLVLSTAAAQASGAAVNLWLPRKSELRVGGPGVTGEDIRLPDSGAVQLQISPGPRARSIAGLVVWIAGGITVPIGLATFLAGVVTGLGEDHSAVSPPGFLPLSDQLFISGAVLVSAGVIGFVTGWICHASAKTRVRMIGNDPELALALPGTLRLSARGLAF